MLFYSILSSTKSKWRHVRGRSLLSPKPAAASPLPKNITDQISTELYERILDCLGPDTHMFSCSLVCRSWTPRSNFLLLGSVDCRPVPLIYGAEKIIWVPIYDPGPENDHGLIYATANGIYSGATRLWARPDITQFEILVDANLLDPWFGRCVPPEDISDCATHLRLGGVFMTIPYTAYSVLRAGACQISDVNHIYENMAFFTVAPQTAFDAYGCRFALAQNSSNSCVLKILNIDIVENQQTSSVEVAQDILLPEPAHGAQFLRQTIAVALKREKLRRGLEVVDKWTTSNPRRTPGCPTCEYFAQESQGDPSIPCVRRIFEVGFYMDTRGNMIRKELVMHWDYACVAFAVYQPYILAFSETHIGVWDIETAKIVQRVQGQYRLLNVPLSGERVLVGHGNDLMEIVFRDTLLD
ncbi:hypothetical protein FB45DRAFT_1060245 [Roridomyces roridus]|uniref:CNH domain-containing protein n=1 Tax=Roridomyces roridus TaxID=1738132 RepID=A0AAD7BMF6_9AGAR|nr:hypothetical protein FB45DRAFT_1060245 [Roridomyces roridus]